MGTLRSLVSVFVAGVVLGVAACSSNDNNNSNKDGGGSTADGGVDTGSAGFALTSPAFADGSPIPAGQTCEGAAFGAGVSPELDWTAGPSGTKSYAIVLKDLSLVSVVPDHAYHWAVWDIPATALKLPAMVASQQSLPGISPAQQYNAGPFASPYSYFGPCPSFLTYCDSTVPRSNDSYAFVIYAMSSATAAVPAVPATGNYVGTLDAYFQSQGVALGSAQLHFTSNAEPTSLPPALTCPPQDAGSTDATAEAAPHDAASEDATTDGATEAAAQDAAADAGHD
jgi:phosphatidylethanolamine-binding protein (PEBP) family uncharacterized protein